ncbi:MAG: glycosyltransferase [Planctomycetes bacterium]|nr:glycosyltransferase [Planctomycetota bacterium]
MKLNTVQPDVKAKRNILPIAPVSDNGPRPFWSVMIPTYNCAQMMRQTLQSVLHQDPGPGTMQVEIVDDFSTRDDPEAVVRELGGDRVQYYRQPANVGPINNFNTCVQRSRGQWVHILHGDDLAQPGFYRRMKQAIAAEPDVGLFFSRCLIIDGQGEIVSLNLRAIEYETASRDPRPMYYSNPICTPGVVVHRQAYETVGGFLPELPHVADWEMWMRVIERCGGRSINEPLARYRQHAASDSAQLNLSGNQLRDYLRLSAILAERYADYDSQQMRRGVAQTAYYQARAAQAAGNQQQAAAYQRLCAELTRDLGWRFRTASWGRRMFHRWFG